MYLKFLGVRGFKSFPERNGLELAPGTCVFVGSNGTGKSNLADAVSWALGQHDVSALRARGPADLVFAGSDELVPMDGAEVTVVLDPRPERTKGDPLSALVCKHGHKATHDGETPEGAITITRRVTVDGHDRYLLDGVDAPPARVREVLADAGIGSPPVTVIRQGELERLLLLDPLERRHVIEAAAGIPGLAGEVAPLKQRLSAAALRHERLTGLLDAVDAERARLLAECDALDAARVLQAQIAHSRAAAVRATLVATTADVPETFEPAVRELLRTLGLPEDVPAGQSHPDLHGEGDGRSDGSPALGDLIARLDAIGPLNTRARMDLEAIGSQRRELESELAALDAELDSLRVELEHHRLVVTDKFAAALRRVEDRFRSYYSLLAPGGEARLVLVSTTTDEADDPTAATSGVDVVARPPGKVLDRVSTLSGGERSLAALSLALAVFQEYPSPFFVLDEVEPALDDTNIRRLQSVLDRVADDRQILMVSHQQRAKETGDVVFGLERNLDGASQVKFRYEPRTRKLDIFRRTWAADDLRRRPIEHASVPAPGLATMGGAGSPTQAALSMATPGPGAGPNRYRQRLFHDDGTFRGIWEAMGNPQGDQAPTTARGVPLEAADPAGATTFAPTAGTAAGTDRAVDEETPRLKPCC